MCIAFEYYAKYDYFIIIIVNMRDESHFHKYRITEVRTNQREGGDLGGIR